VICERHLSKELQHQQQQATALMQLPKEEPQHQQCDERSVTKKKRGA
jgi:hypothetical protein